MSDICRICLQKQNDMFSIYDKYSDEYTEPICSMIMYCASVKIEKGDGLPDLLCKHCKIRLETAYLFKRDCELAENKLRQSIRTNYNKMKTENSDSNQSRQNQNCNDDLPSVKLEVDSEAESCYYANNNIKSEDPLNQNAAAIIDIQQSNNNNAKFCTVVLKEEEDPIEPDTSFNTELFPPAGFVKQEDEEREKFRLKIEKIISKNIYKKRNRERIKREFKLQKQYCYPCSKIFCSKDEFNTHVTQNHLNQTFVCEMDACKKEFTDWMKYAIHFNTDHFVENFLTCQQCQNSYRHKKNLDRHIYSKHGDRPYVCEHCSERFQEPKALDQHINIHTEKYKCEACSKCFSSAFGLMNHRRTHNTDDSYTCEECDGKFTTKLFLERHMCDKNRSKGDEDKRRPRRRAKNQLCTYCGQRFHRPIDLTIHTRLHTGVKPYSCDQCEYRCHSKHLLQSHIRIHTGDRPFKCSYCEKAFGTKGYLTIHERFHSGHRPYICSTCQKGFTNSKDLKVHERTHTGIKLFSCDVCGNSFTTLHYLRVHTKKHEN